MRRALPWAICSTVFGIAVLIHGQAVPHITPGRKTDYYDAEQRQIRKVYEYDSEGRQHGDWTNHDENGQMLSRTIFYHGQPLLLEGWYPVGQKRYHQPHSAGLAHGLWLWWAPDGAVLAESWFHHGTGVSYVFDEAGRETKRQVWVGGVLIQEQSDGAK